jgi:hypothetical protein
MAKPKDRPKRMGRPTKAPVEGERVPLGLRVTAEAKRKLAAAAIKSGRSISQEAELRIERSFQMEELGPHLAKIGVLEVAMKELREAVLKGWGQVIAPGTSTSNFPEVLRRDISHSESKKGE